MLTVSAIGDSFTIAEDTSLSGNVLEDNGSGADSDTVAGQALVVATTPVSGPGNGSVSLNSNGSFNYTPNANFWGTDSFEYRVTGSSTATAVVSIEVTPVDDPPTPSDFQLTVDENSGRLRIVVLTDEVRSGDDDRDGNNIALVTAVGTAIGNVTHDPFIVFYTPAPNFSGEDSFTYTVTDGISQTGTATITINVLPINVVPTNEAPDAANDAFSMTNGRTLEGNLLADNGNGIDSDPDGDTITVETTPVSAPARGTLNLNSNGTFAYTPNNGVFGTDTFTYRLTDGTLTDTATVTISVNGAPTARNDSFDTASGTAVNGNVLNNNGGGADTDPDGGTLTISTTAVDSPNNGSVSLNANGTFTYTPNAGFAGTDSFQYELRDGQGGTDTATVTINVETANSNPVARADAFSTNEDSPVSGNVLNNNGSGADSDAETNSSISVTPTPVSGPSNGTVSLNSNGTFTYTPATNFNGTDSFTYRLLDGDGGTAQATVTITVNARNDNPVARNDSFSTGEDVALNGNVRDNNGSGADSDVDGDSLSVNTSPVTGPANGTLQLNANGTFTYTPAANFSGNDSFTYELLDGNGGTDTAVVSINVSSTNDNPVARDDAFSTNEDTPVSGNLLSNNGNGVDSDPEGQSLSVPSTVSDPSNGVLDLNSNGQFTYTPAANFSGSDSFVYRLRDSQGGTDTATVSITIAATNDPPVARDDSFNANHNTAVSGDVLSNNGNGADSDADNDSLQVNLLASDQVQNGTLDLDSDGSFTYTPNNGFQGQDTFSYVLRDGSAATATATVTITVLAPSNSAPVARNDSFTTNEDTSVSGNVIADNGSGIDSDPNGDSITVSISTQPASGSVTLQANGSFSYQPNSNFNGKDGFTYELRDANGATDTGSVTIQVQSVNDQPILKNDRFTTSQNTPVSGNVLANNGLGVDSDIEDTTLTVDTNPVTTPNNGTVSIAADGSFTYSPGAGFSGTDSFVYRAFDSNSGSSTAVATITVTSTANVSPVARDDQFTGNEDINLLANLLVDNGNGADSDANNDALTTLGPTAGPSNGTVTISANGDFAYRPNANFFGEDSFDYTLRDENGATSTGTVSITLRSVNDQPIAQDDEFTIEPNEQLTGDLLADNGNGPDQDIDGEGVTIRGTRVRPRLGELILNSDGTFVYQPFEGLSGADIFTYSLNDAQGDLSFGQVTIVIEENVSELNLTSISSSSADGEAKPGDQVTVTASFTDTSAAGRPDALIDWGDGTEPESVTVPTTGNSLNATHTYAESGSYTVELTISNSNDDSDSITTAVNIGEGAAVPSPRVVGFSKNDGKDVHDFLQSVSVDFDQDVSASLDPSDIVLLDSTGTVIDTSSATVQWSVDRKSARWDFSAISFDVDRYTVRLLGQEVQASGRLLDGNADGTGGDNFETNVIVTWRGDANLDLAVDFPDFLALSQNFTKADKNWGGGDFNADGFTNFADFLALSQNFTKEKSIPAPAAAQQVPIFAAFSWVRDDAFAEEDDWLL